MLDNTITLAVDTANTGTVTNEVYSRYSEAQNETLYIGPDHAVTARNQLRFARTFPTKSGNFNGAVITEVKFTQDISVPGVDSTTTEVRPVVITLRISDPVGDSVSNLVHFRQRLLALLDDDTIMNKFNRTQEI